MNESLENSTRSLQNPAQKHVNMLSLTCLNKLKLNLEQCTFLHRPIHFGVYNRLIETIIMYLPYAQVLHERSLV